MNNNQLLLISATVALARTEKQKLVDYCHTCWAWSAEKTLNEFEALESLINSDAFDKGSIDWVE